VGRSLNIDLRSSMQSLRAGVGCSVHDSRRESGLDLPNSTAAAAVHTSTSAVTITELTQ